MLLLLFSLSLFSTEFRACVEGHLLWSEAVCLLPAAMWIKVVTWLPPIADGSLPEECVIVLFLLRFLIRLLIETGLLEASVPKNTWLSPRDLFVQMLSLPETRCVILREF